MKNSPRHILLTGVTGILGSHVLYELLLACLKGGIRTKITVVVRSTDKESARQRVMNVLSDPNRPHLLYSFTAEELFHFIDIIDAGLNDLDASDLAGLRKTAGLHIIHCAAHTNLSVNPNVYDTLYEHNYKGTLHLLKWASGILEKFTFIGSAYSAGHRGGIIPDSYKELTPSGDKTEILRRNWRNPYEEIKTDAGYAVIKFCVEHGIKWQILRPSTICGRVIHKPLYYTPKFNVFYLFGKFFLKVAKPENRNELVRIVANPDSVLNVVPVDYIAKAIVRVFDNDEIREMNLVYSNSLPVDYIVHHMIGQAGFKSEIVDTMPQDQSVVEKMYYKFVGPQFTEYIFTPWHAFDTTVLRGIMQDIPEVNMHALFPDLYGYAVSHQFGEAVAVAE
jgi:nucleoside-diphosphate-sugar epimerase